MASEKNVMIWNSQQTGRCWVCRNEHK